MKDMSNNTDAPIAGTVGAGKLTDLPKVCDEILRAVKPDTDFGFVRIAGSYTGIREYNLVALVNDHAQLLSETAELRADVERANIEKQRIVKELKSCLPMLSSYRVSGMKALIASIENGGTNE